MKVYTVKAVAAFLGLSERRIRQLKSDGIITEYAPGLFELKKVTREYIKFLQKGTETEAIDYNTEKAKLVRAKRENEELELRTRKNELHETKEIELIITTMLINFKSRLCAIPAKLAPIMAKKTDKAEIFKIIKAATDEALNELSDFDTMFTEEIEDGKGMK